jgi:hypothetical protein
MDEKKEVKFFPFHAINEFMTDEYRAQVVRQVLNALPTLSDELKNPVERLSKKAVVIPGFRNSQKAPAALKVKPTIDAFEKNPALVAAILAAWAGLNADLRQQVYDLLVNRGWDILPPDADRSKLPGFIMQWYNGEDFDTLFQAIHEAHPGIIVEQNDVSLMAVWLCGRLPYEFVDMPQKDPSGPQETSLET